GPSGNAVQQIDHGIAASGMAPVTRREVDVDGLPSFADRRAREVEPNGAAPLLHVGRIMGRREAAVEPVVVDVAVRADEPADEEDGEQQTHEPAPAWGLERGREHNTGSKRRNLTVT